MRRAPASAGVVLGAALLAPGCVVPAGSVVVDIDRIGIEYAPSRIRGVLERHGYEPVLFRNDTSNALTYVERNALIEESRFRTPTTGSLLIVRLDRQDGRIYLSLAETRGDADAELTRLRRALAAEYGEDRVR